MPHELNAIATAIHDEPKGLTKAKKTIYSASLELTEAEIRAYVIAGVKRDNPSVKDYELTVQFRAETDETCPPITAMVSGELVK